MDWHGVREGLEENVSRVWKKGIAGVREELPAPRKE